jgi:hypothetical protein
MKKWTVILDGMLLDEEFSVLRKRFPRLEEEGEVCRVRVPENVFTPEALFLGLHPEEAQMAHGPLTVSGLGADPPERSTQFAVACLSLQDDRISLPPSTEIEPDEWKVLNEVGRRLNAKNLTFLPFRAGEAALVWEELRGMKCTPPSEAGGSTFSSVLPTGERDEVLRRWIDDSINLLFESEFNRRRIDHGKPPLNVLWPWGPGQRFAVPRLVIRRGQPALVVSQTLRLAGLARLAGYRVFDSAPYAKGVNSPFAKYNSAVGEWKRGVTVFSDRHGFALPEQAEELDYWISNFSSQFLTPFMETVEAENELLVLCCNSTSGIAVHWQKGVSRSNHVPFDERALGERRLPLRDFHELVDAMLR